MQCRVCHSQTRSFFATSTDGLDEPFLDCLRQQFQELRLDQCSQCGCLWTQDERADDSVLISAYQKLAGSYFESPPSERKYHQFYQWLEGLVKPHARGNEVLDVGCGDGLFLASLSSKWSKHGLEPSAAGAELARRKNLNVSCGTLDDLPPECHVDLLCALDVIEHVVEPHAFIDALKRRLRRGGVLLILTGDATSFSARLAGPQWSYLKWCGHVSVFSAAGLRKLLQDHGFQVIEWERCEHPSSPGMMAWGRVHLLEPLRRVMGRRKSWYPFWRDHQVVVARLV